MKSFLVLFVLLSSLNIDLLTGKIKPPFEQDQVHAWEYVFGEIDRVPLDLIQQLTLRINEYTEVTYIASGVALLMYSILVNIAILKFHAACCKFLLKIPLYLVYLPFLDPLNFYYSAVIGKDLYATAVGLLSVAILLHILAALREGKVFMVLFLLLTFTSFNFMAFGSWRIQFFMLNCGFLTLAVSLFWLGYRLKGALLIGVCSIVTLFFWIRGDMELLSIIASPAAEFIVPGIGTFQFPSNWIALLSTTFGPNPSAIVQSAITLPEKFYFVIRYFTFSILIVYAWLKTSDPLIKALISATIMIPILTSPWYMNIMVSERHLIYLKVLSITLGLSVLSWHRRKKTKSTWYITARRGDPTNDPSSVGMN